MSESGWSLGRLKGQCVLVFWRDGKRQRHRLGTSDPREAERRAPSIFAELTRPKGTKVADLWNGYVADMTGRAVVGTMTHTWKALRDRFGTMSAEAITIADCRAHTEARRKAGIKDGTIHTELGHLRMVLLWAGKRRIIDRAPDIERPTKPQSVEKHLTARQVIALAEAAKAPHIALFVHLAYGTAGRSAALLGLTWDRVHFEHENIDLRDPGMKSPHKGRAVVPMTRTIKTRLLEAKRGAMSPFVIEWAGRQVGSVKKGLASAARDAGLPKVSPHVLRHSSAVRMAESGEPMEEIASYLGHRDVNVTRQVYARFSTNHLRRAAAALELDGPPNEVGRTLKTA